MASRAYSRVNTSIARVIEYSSSRMRVAVSLATACALLLSACSVDKLLGSSDNSNNNDPPQRVLSLRFATQPRTTMAGAKFNPPVRVVVEDQHGQLVTDFDGTIRVALVPDEGDDAELRGTTSRRAEGGAATFENLTIEERGNYILSAEAEGAVTATSAEFGITSGQQRRILVISGNNQTGSVGETLDPYVVKVVDEFDNALSGVLLNWSVVGGGGSVSPQTAFSDAKGESRALHTLGLQSGDQLVRSSLALDPSSSVTFSASAAPGEPARMVILQQPSDVRMLDEIKPPVLVVIQDAAGNTVTEATGLVTATIMEGTGSPGAVLFGGTVRPVQGGMATFDNLRIDTPGTAYQIVFSYRGLTITSVAFNVSAIQ